MCERVDGKAPARDTAIGRLPADGALDLDGVSISPQDLDELLRIDKQAWKREVDGIRQHFGQFGDRLPERLRVQLAQLEQRLNA
jgi:phosphoenolpyruvate carboxykinase (GTP)